MNLRKQVVGIVGERACRRFRIDVSEKKKHTGGTSVTREIVADVPITWCFVAAATISLVTDVPQVPQVPCYSIIVA